MVDEPLPVPAGSGAAHPLGQCMGFRSWSVMNRMMLGRCTIEPLGRGFASTSRSSPQHPGHGGRGCPRGSGGEEVATRDGRRSLVGVGDSWGHHLPAGAGGATTRRQASSTALISE